MKVKIYHNKNFLNGRKIQLQQEEIHIWCIRWGEIIDFLKEKAYIMDCQEKEKAAQYRFYEDRMRYMAGKICTRILLMRYLNENSIVFLASSSLSIELICPTPKLISSSAINFL